MRYTTELSWRWGEPQPRTKTMEFDAPNDDAVLALVETLLNGNTVVDGGYPAQTLAPLTGYVKCEDGAIVGRCYSIKYKEDMGGISMTTGWKFIVTRGDQHAGERIVAEWCEAQRTVFGPDGFWGHPPADISGFYHDG